MTPGPHRGRLLVLALLALGGAVLGGCATSAAPPARSVGGSLQQPFRDLNVLRETPAEALVAARLAPYGAPREPVCETIAAELALLDAALGPDIGAAGDDEGENLAARLTSDAIGDLIGLPYRGIVRRVSGAEKREREARAQKLAGSIRRGFLKGWAASAGCAPAAAP